jgi:hypothetical protein
MSEANQKDSLMFMQLVMTFQAAAWQAMGKIKNPVTDKIERDLNQARYSIDMLEMLRSRTKGSSTDDEQKFLNRALSELELNYVDELNKEQKSKSEAKAEPPKTDVGRNDADKKDEKVEGEKATS